MSIDSSRIKIHYISQLINSLNMLAEKWCGIFICLLKHKKNITTGESELRNWGSVSTNKVFKTLAGIIAAYWRHSNRLNKHLFQPYILTGASNSTQDSEVKQWCRAALKPRKLNCARQVLEKWVFGDWFDIWFTNSWQTRDLTTYLKIGPWDCSLVGFTYKLSLTPLFTKKNIDRLICNYISHAQGNRATVIAAIVTEVHEWAMALLKGHCLQTYEAHTSLKIILRSYLV